MARFERLGVRVYGLAAILLGAIALAFGDFAAVWQPVPAATPERTLLAYAVATALVLGGVIIQWRRTARLGALILTDLYLLDVILLHLPRVIAHPTSFAPYAGLAEQAALLAGGLLAYAQVAELKGPTRARIIKLGEILFGVCLISFGAAHFIYLSQTADAVPQWLAPGPVFWAFATGVAHLAAALAILSGVLARLAARLLTLMFIGFGVLVHAPTLIGDPHSHFNWAANAVNLSLVGAAWVVADALGKRTALAH